MCDGTLVLVLARCCRSALALTLLLGACTRPEPSGLATSTVIRWEAGGSLFGGGETLTVTSGREIRYVFSDDTGQSREHRGSITPQELDNVIVQLRGVCSTRSRRDEGEPEEVQATLRVRSSDLDCAVTLWDNEWRELAPTVGPAIGQLRGLSSDAPDP